MQTVLLRDEIHELPPAVARDMTVAERTAFYDQPAPLERRYAGAYAIHDTNSPILGGLDILALVFAVAVTLGPLAAYAVGWGA